MKLDNEFVVAADADRTWRFLTDLAGVARCLPGAELEGRDGDDYLGTVKVKVGPVSAQFRGTARFLEQDGAAHTATIGMSGKDVKGQAVAKATMRAWLEPVDTERTRVLVDTDLDISGRLAQFGRGPIADVSNRLVGQFTENLKTELDASPAPRAEPPRESADLDALSVVGPTVAKTLAGPLVGFLLGVLVGRAWRRAAAR